VFSAVFCGFGPSLADARGWGIGWLWDISYARWGAEAFYTEEVSFFQNVYDVEAAARVYGYTLNRFAMDVALMFVVGTVLRIVGFALLVSLNRQQQK
jgi:hypothetical protein